MCFHPENLKCDIVDKDKFLFHQKNKQAKIRRQFNTSVMAEESCKHKRTEKKNTFFPDRIGISLIKDAFMLWSFMLWTMLSFAISICPLVQDY